MARVVKNPPANAGDMRCGFDPRMRRSPGGGHGTPPQCSCLENPIDRGAWRATVHKVTKSATRLNDLTHNTHIHGEVELTVRQSE